ncbi:TonB-dependent receptor [Flavobacterium psychroterrae]|uniref:TonB-dependent receptor n=1 Tax=Flavobacterium psychroterrae TaxID=2133767 RepID=A0ABS5PIJ5_9FLAO|nr:TonB-dependent receptor [Flavobacterium psychroterrae]MBS7234129.1 TonB-dependent receptor [Flavobacterium psychroterrae]
MNKQVLLSIIVLFIFPLFLFAQVKVSGKIVDQNGKTLELMEILMLNSDSTLVKSELSKSNGEFTVFINRGEYLFLVKRLGNVLWKEKFNLTGDLEVGSIMVTLSDNQLSEVIIRSKKKLFETKVDRVVYNISNDVFNKGSNLADALRRVPRLNVENDAVKIIGKSGSVKFLIDGRIQNLSDEALKNKIRGLRVEQISKVEIIPNPPSKYSAEGNGGMINIILKKDENFGLQGSANTGMGVQFEKVSTDQGVNLNYKIKKLDASLNINNSNTSGTNIRREIYDFEKTTTTVENAPDFNSRNKSINTVLQYKISSKISIGTTLDFVKGDNQVNSLGTSQYYNKVLQKLDSLMYSKDTGYNNSNSSAIALYADYSIDSLGKKMSLTYNYSYNKNLSDSYNNAELTTNLLTQNIVFSNIGANRYKVNGVLLDFELPFKFGKIETGGAYANISNNTSIAYYNQLNIIDPKRSNLFKYNEKTKSGYLSIQNEWNNRWSSKMGLRLESTEIGGYSSTLLTANRNNYTKLFPTLFVSYSPNDNYAFSLSYSKRLDRPSFYDLNPFRYYSNAFNYLSGNPELLPSYTHSLELSCTMHNNLNFITYANYITDGISYLTIVNTDDSYVVHPENNFVQKKIGLIGSYRWDVFKWNSLNINANGYYADLNSQRGVQEIKGLGGSFSLRNSIQLNKNKSSLLELSYTNYLPSKAQYSDFITKNQAYFTINFKQMLLNNNLVFNLYITDIFRQNIGRSEKLYDTFSYSLNNDNHNKGFYFSTNYTFGNKNVNEIYRDTKNRDKYRGGK